MHNTVFRARQAVTTTLLSLAILSLQVTLTYAGETLKGRSKKTQSTGDSSHEEDREVEEVVETFRFPLTEGQRIYVPPEIKKAMEDKDWESATKTLRHTTTTLTSRVASYNKRQQDIARQLSAEEKKLEELTRLQYAEEQKLAQQEAHEIEQINARETDYRKQCERAREETAKSARYKRQRKLSVIDDKVKRSQEAVARLKALNTEIQHLLTKLKDQMTDQRWELFMEMSKRYQDDEQQLIDLKTQLETALRENQLRESTLDHARKEHNNAKKDLDSLDKTYSDIAATELKNNKSRIEDYQNWLTQALEEQKNIQKKYEQQRDTKKEELLKKIKETEELLSSEPEVDKDGLTRTEQLEKQLEHQQILLEQSLKTMHETVIPDISLSLEGDEVVVNMEELTQGVPISLFKCLPVLSTCCCKKYRPWLNQTILISGQEPVMHSYVPLEHGQWQSSHAISMAQTVTTEEGNTYEIYVIQENEAMAYQLISVNLQIYAVPWADTFDLESSKDKDTTRIRVKHGLMNIKIVMGNPSSKNTRKDRMTITPLGSSVFDQAEFNLLAPSQVAGDASNPSQHLPALENKPGMKMLRKDGYLPIFNMSTFTHMAKKYLDAFNKQKVPQLLKSWNNKGNFDFSHSSTRHPPVSWIRKQDNEYFYHWHHSARSTPVTLSASYSSTGITFSGTNKAGN